MKTCSKCGVSQSISEFSKVGGRKGDLLRSYCKSCSKVLTSKWVAANRDKKNAMNAKWRADNPEKVKESYIKTSVKNPGRYSKWYAANIEKAKASSLRWYLANPEAVRIKDQNRRAKKSGGKLSKGLAEKLFKLQRGKCPCCGKLLGEDYHLDHVVPLALGGSNTDDNIQLLRAKCNMHKHASHPVDFMQKRGFLL